MERTAYSRSRTVPLFADEFHIRVPWHAFKPIDVTTFLLSQSPQAVNIYSAKASEAHTLEELKTPRVHGQRPHFPSISAQLLLSYQFPKSHATLIRTNLCRTVILDIGLGDTMSDWRQPLYTRLVDTTSTDTGQKAMFCLQFKISIARFKRPSIALFGETLARDHMLHFLNRNLIASVTRCRGACRACKVLRVFQFAIRLNPQHHIFQVPVFVFSVLKPMISYILLAAKGLAVKLGVLLGDEGIATTAPGRIIILVLKRVISRDSTSLCSRFFFLFFSFLGTERTRSSNSRDVERDAAQLTHAIAIPHQYHFLSRGRSTLEARI